MKLAIYLILMAGVTYLIRAFPFTVFTRKIKSKFLKSFLYYVPFAVLSAMTFPAVFYATGNIYTATAGVIVALIFAFFKCSLTTVALLSAAAVFLTSFIF